MGKRPSSETSTSTSIQWTTRMDKVLINALETEVANGNQVNGQFTSRAYVNIVKECSEKLDCPLAKDKLKNRLKTLKSNFNEVHDLFGFSGWGWNEDTILFENADEVWDSLCEKKPKVRKWKNTPFPHYKALSNLYSKDRASGTESQNAKEQRMHLASKGALSDKAESDIEAKVSDSMDSADSSKVKKKRKVQDVFLDQVLTIKEGLDNVAQALREGIVERGRPRVYPPSEIFEEVSKMEFDAVSCRKAYRFLSGKQSRVRELFGCPSEERKDYLIEMMLDENIA